MQILLLLSGGGACLNAKVQVRGSGLSVDFLHLAPYYKVRRTQCVNTAGDPPPPMQDSQWVSLGVDDASNTWQMQKLKNKHLPVKRQWHTKETQTEMWREFVVIGADAGVGGCCKHDHLICSTSRLNNTDDLMLLWRICAGNLPRCWRVKSVSNSPGFSRRSRLKTAFWVIYICQVSVNWCLWLRLQHQMVAFVSR